MNMPGGSWDRAIAVAELLAAQHDFMSGDATGLQALYSHRDDVTIMGGSTQELPDHQDGPAIARLARTASRSSF